jgi:site-specific recombinase XerD
MTKALAAGGHLRENTLKTYLAKNNLLREYCPGATLAQINQGWLKGLENWLLTKKRFGLDHAGRIVGYVKMLMRLAVNEQAISYSPVEHYKLRRGRPELPVFLTEAELQAIREYKSVSEAMLRTRDLFLFQCLTGMAFVDLERFGPDCIQESDGQRWLHVQRHKSGEVCLIPLLAEAGAILARFGGKLPLTCLQIHNKSLKEIAAQCGIAKKLTSHMGRKTFATLMLNRGVSLEAVAAMLGHANTAMTQRHYARVSTERIGRELERAGVI